MQYDIALIRKIQEKRDNVYKERNIKIDSKEDIDAFARVFYRHVNGSAT